MRGLKARSTDGIFRLDIHHAEPPVAPFMIRRHHPKKIDRNDWSRDFWMLAFRHQNHIALMNYLYQFRFGTVSINHLNAELLQRHVDVKIRFLEYMNSYS